MPLLQFNMSWKFHKPKFEYEETFKDFGWPWAGHKNFGYDLVRNFNPKIIVELGTHKGTSFWSFCQAVKDGEMDSELFAVDTWKGEEHAGYYSEEIFEEVKAIRKKYYGNIKISLMRKFFDEALDDFKDHSIDLLHIDGFHTYESVKHDFETWLTKMNKEGIVVFHDIFVKERDFGVYKFWEELKNNYITIEFYQSYGLGILFFNEAKGQSFENMKKSFKCIMPILQKTRGRR